jgi:succinate-semialdehyde dehydrogenase / glutarate-semialdehyde dehydrogenase
MDAINPATNELIKKYDEHSPAEVKAILQAVDETQQVWKYQSFACRSELMKKAAAVLRKNREEYARTITLEMGKPIKESRAEVEKSAWVCDYYAENAEKILADEPLVSDASRSFAAFEPLGIVLAVMPWNYPFWQVFRFAAPALMARNGGVLKHASNVPGSALAIEAVFQEAGFPKDIFRTLMIGSRQVEAVIRDERVKAVTLTGSELAGSKVAAIAGEEIKKTVMELGGSDPFIVLEDADIPGCVLTSAQSRMLNTGQSCISAKRFIVVESRVKEFEEQQAMIMSKLKIGDPLDESTQVGPMAREDLLQELDAQVQKSIAMGAKVLTGGKRREGSGAYYEPTVLTNVKEGMPVYHEETFGPVSAIISVKDEEEAIRVANGSIYGLGGSVWTRDLARGERVARQIESGAVFVNGMTKSDPRLPFGGIKKSGYGRELSHYGIKEFVNIKTIWIA